MALFTAIGTMIMAGFGMSAGAIVAAGGTAFAIGATATAVTAGAIAANQAGAKSERIIEKKATSTMNRMNALANVAANPAYAQAKAQTKTNSKLTSIARSETIYTSPLGIGGQAELGVKSLLGK